jgi:hypothetical protein
MRTKDPVFSISISFSPSFSKNTLTDRIIKIARPYEIRKAVRVPLSIQGRLITTPTAAAG